jgi:hypothetical protein
VLPPDYTFQPSDSGVASFVVILNTLGDQTVTATDTVSGITGSATITVTLGGDSPSSGAESSRLGVPFAWSRTPVPAARVPAAPPISANISDPAPAPAAVPAASGPQRSAPDAPSAAALDAIWEAWDGNLLDGVLMDDLVWAYSGGHQGIGAFLL